MKMYSSRQAARKLGLPETTLSTYIGVGKIPAPQSIIAGNMKVYLWTEEEIEHVRQLLPKIANGRKTRYQKLKEKEKTPPRTAMPHKKRKPKKK
jgi:hypothetical protein